MSIARYNHTATLLANGMVLVAGGEDDSNILDSAALYDPQTGSWSNTGSLVTARTSHTATLLTNGKVLVIGGGVIANNEFIILGSVELYDPETGSWANTGSMITARAFHTTTLLNNGQVLATGGIGSSGNDLVILNSTESYDSATATWSAANTF
jgi:N-acetylneuraminic acid mutarotase